RTEPGTSDSFEMTVVSDVLHASGVRVSAASIYPYKDGYKDTLKITGVREEPITVTIKIYKPSGGLLRTVTLAKGSGSYSWTWNGKTSSGSILPEGKYRITQTLKDAGTGVASFTSYVTLSKKRLVTLTKTITKLGSSFTATGTAGTGTIKVSSAGSVRLSTGGAGWAGVGWQFSL